MLMFACPPALRASSGRREGLRRVSLASRGAGQIAGRALSLTPCRTGGLPDDDDDDDVRGSRNKIVPGQMRRYETFGGFSSLCPLPDRSYVSTLRHW